MEGIVISAMIVLFASVLQACTGFGFSIMATPFLLFVYAPHVAIQINIILSILISVFILPKIIKDVDKKLLIKLVKGSIIGAPFGIGIFLFLDVQFLKIVISLLILFLTCLLILQFSVKQTSAKDHISGGLSGMLTTSIGMPGPPLLLYFSGVKIEKAVLRSTTLAFYLFIYVVALGMQITFGSTNKEIWFTSLILVPVSICGMILGQWLFKFINQKVFQLITYVILGVTGFYLLFSSI
ncbi:sulfite exporter TauE/SafE family protein [Alkalihalobacillus sp. BA299]|uniref:sulfite exporter TauE/SafE family protein n=1 Tax=Alkalihalobacillus sp. BA299 TaxID=2815938 RepID=UPI001ADB0B79|nr:sulfite exporter TauE/SafE family protein [Alkalihalobacillus sp. BA299]